MIKLIHHITLEVRSIVRETDRVLLYELADPDDWPLPPFTAGAHIDVHIQHGLVRQYSLCGSPDIGNRYWIAVQREEEGRGGSTALQSTLRIGSIVAAGLPRNHFGINFAADHHVLIAGGIGITPFMSMLDTLQSRAMSFELHYCTRSREDSPFLTRLRNLPAARHIHVYHSVGPHANRLDLDALLAEHRCAGDIYGCGPAGLVDALLSKTADWPAGRIHVEKFGGSKIAGAGADVAFDVALARSGSSIGVERGETILEALRRADVEIGYSCEAGVCKACQTRYLTGSPIHRDLVLSSEERREFMLPCVSGCSSERLVLDL